MPEALSLAVARARTELAATWPLVVDTTVWSRTDGEVRVTGGVLVAAQARMYVDILGEDLEDVPTPAILSAVDSAWHLHSWVEIVGEGAIDVQRAPDGDDLQTQWSPPASLRVFASREGRSLIQLADGTLGWCDSDRLRPTSPRTDPWATIRRPVAGASVPSDAPVEEAARLARSRLDRPYRWGGNTAAAADCSGLIQSIVQEVAGVLLPKHTGDQRRLGARVAAADIGPGDLVFVRGRDRNIGHVGIALSSGDGISVVHSCLSRGRVLEESLAVFLDRYRFTGARRPIDWTGAGG